MDIPNVAQNGGDGQEAIAIRTENDQTIHITNSTKQ
jgi:hypothetical protein